jgi:hypothetical protein
VSGGQKPLLYAPIVLQIPPKKIYTAWCSPYLGVAQNSSFVPSNKKVTRQQKTKKISDVKTLDLYLHATHRPIK